jgi:hypothetical protein
MKRRDLKKGGGPVFFLAVMILGALLMIGCGGSGDTGPPGPPGAPGTPGTTESPPPEVTTAETCAICHSAGKIADIAVAHPDPTGENVTLSSIILTNPAGTPVVSFHAAFASGGAVTDLVDADFIFMIADLVPAGTLTATQGTWDTDYFERWARERASDSSLGVLDTTNAASGNYTYTFATAFADATTEAPDYNEAHTQRLVILVSGHDDASGNAITNNTVGFLDFVTPAAGGAVTTSVSQRLFVTADACKKCHGAPFQQAAHADRYLDTRTCVVCHSPIGHYGAGGSPDMVANNAYLPILIHQIHAAIDNPEFATEIRGLGFGAVTYPQSFQKHPEQGDPVPGNEEIPNCVSCHSNPSNLALGTGDKIDNWKNHPTAEVCESCHTDVDLATGQNHPGFAQQNGTCLVCHNGGLAPTTAVAHDTTPTGVNIPEYDVTLNITPPVNGSFYDPGTGEAPEVRVTLNNHNGSAVAPAIYTTPQDVKGHSGGGLFVASLYVYGPRAKASPVLATCTETDPAFSDPSHPCGLDPNGDPNPPTQAHSLFVGGTDPQVTTDMTGFGYQLLEIPAGMKPGTYMVRVRIGDYGYISNTNYRIESTAFRLIQIGTSTVEKKVVGDDPVSGETACVVCHSTRTAPFHDARHVVPFDTDECLACHDQSGGHPDALTNRIHAVHSANSAGDIINIESVTPTRDWSDITFPQNIQSPVTGHTADDGQPRCIACHTPGSSSGTYLTNPFMLPCVGCHTVNGDLDHMRQNGGPF